MPTVKNLVLKYSYNSREFNLIEEFYIPCLNNAIKYDRAVGYFTGEILKTIAEGISDFVQRGGAIRLVCSPRLTEADIRAIEEGYCQREKQIQDAIIREIDKLPDEVLDSHLNLLTWLIATARLEIKIALPTEVSVEGYGIYHEKLGLFYDESGEYIAFSGSNNETLGGILYNYESFDVFRSWVECDRCIEKKEHFEKLWNGSAIGLAIYEFPVAARERLLKKVVPQEKPHLDLRKAAGGLKRKSIIDKFLCSLWYFQNEAIDKFKAKNWTGILSMATGTGKTRTAIGAIATMQRTIKERFFTIIVAPQNTILVQWKKDSSAIGLFDKAVFADGSNPKWKEQLADMIIDLNDGIEGNFGVLTTYNSLSSKDFIRIIERVKASILLVADEVHWAGADTFQLGLLSQYTYRLGLSATPRRFMDQEGTDLITGYFGEVVYEFGLDRALSEINPSTGESFLCPYNYFPVFVALSGSELVEYHEYCEKIRQQYAKEHDKSEPSEYLQRLYEKRQAVVVNATSKYLALDQILNIHRKIKYLLVYCSPEQIDKAQNILNELEIINHRFTGEEGTTPREEYEYRSERDHLLGLFEKGTYAALVAMRCLDEGIDIPRAETAILVASSLNPRQYIQRRGRLLRRHPSKKIVNIYDLVVLPYPTSTADIMLGPEEIKMIKKELIRQEEFSSLADNKLEAINKIFEIKKKYRFFEQEEPNETNGDQQTNN